MVELFVGLVPTDHWIVCDGMEIACKRLLSLREAQELAKDLVKDNPGAISLQHVGRHREKGDG